MYTTSERLLWSASSVHCIHTMAAVGYVLLLRRGSNLLCKNAVGFHSSVPSYVDEKWKTERGLPLNPLQTHAFKEWPDYSFVDGRVTPLSAGQLRRWKVQREMAKKTVKLLHEVTYAFEKDQKLQEERELEKQRRLSNKLKSKGANLLKG